jgi:Na+/melibiose symporter-like transporter
MTAKWTGLDKKKAKAPARTLDTERPNPEQALLEMHRPVHLRAKVVYGAGQIALAMKTILFGLFSLYFYTTVMGLSGTLVGVASAIGLLWDAIIDPVIGTMSDHARSRLGKRHVFMLAGAVGMGPSFWVFFNPPPDLPTAALFAWLLAANLLVRTMTSLFGIPYFALGAELSRNYDERTSVTGIRAGLALFGTMATAVFTFLLFFPATSQGGDPKLNLNGYRDMGFFCGLVMSLVGLLTTFGTLSYRQVSAGGGSKWQIGEPLFRFFTSIVAALRNASFRIVLGSYSLLFLGVVINNTLAIHFLTYYVNITVSRHMSAFQLAFFVGALAGVAFWMRISRIVEKHLLLFTGTVGTAVVMGCAYSLLGEGHLFGTRSLPPLLFGHGLAGFFASIIWIIPTSMIADVVDEDELSSGSRREGTFFGLFHFGEQIAAGAAILVTGLLIDRFAGLVPGQAQQSAVTILRIGMLYSLLPSTLLAVAALPVLRYSLNRRRVASIQMQLGHRPSPDALEPGCQADGRFLGLTQQEREAVERNDTDGDIPKE